MNDYDYLLDKRIEDMTIEELNNLHKAVEGKKFWYISSCGVFQQSATVGIFDANMGYTVHGQLKDDKLWCMKKPVYKSEVTQSAYQDLLDAIKVGYVDFQSGSNLPTGNIHSNSCVFA